MSLTVLALLAATIGSPQANAQLCPAEGLTQVDQRGDATVRRLDRLPPAQALLAVLRRENGCTRPQTVREFRDLTQGR